MKISDYWMPHSHCIANDPETIWLHVLGDSGTAISYFLIPVALVWTSWRYRMDHTKEFRGLMVHGSMFIFNCGLTHVMNVWNWWHVNYTASGIISFCCAVVSATFTWKLWKYLKNHPLQAGGRLKDDEWFEGK